MKHKIPILKFSLVLAAILIFMKLVELTIAAAMKQMGEGFSLTLFIANVFLMVLFYVIVTALCAFIFNKISDKKGKLLEIYYLIVAESILVFILIFLLSGLSTGWMMGLYSAIDYLLRTLVALGITAFLLFRNEPSGKEEEKKAKPVHKAKAHPGHKSRKK